MCIRIYIFNLKKETSKKAKQRKNTKEAKETKEEKRISPENRKKKKNKKNKFSAERVKSFLVTRISVKKRVFFVFVFLAPESIKKL